MTYVKTLEERRQYPPHSDAGEGRQLAQAERLGSAAFRRDYGVKYAYSSGSMYQGIASRKLVVAMARAKMMSFFGSGGLSLPLLQEAILGIQSDLNGESFGMNMLADYEFPERKCAGLNCSGP